MASSEKKEVNRINLVDSLRGVAAIWVMFYHFYNALLPEIGYQLFWAPLDLFFQNGFLGVYIFFVLSGFVINLSLRSKEVTGQFFLRFLLRRSIRLDIPYWTVIIMTGLSVLVMSNFGLSRKEVFDFSDYLLNMAYLDNLINTPSIVAVGWTLQYEIQFYLFFALLLVAFRALHIKNTYSNYILLFTFLVSILYWFDWFPFYRKSLFIDYWFCFLLGAIVNDVINKRMGIWFFWSALSLGVFHSLLFKDLTSATAVCTAILLFAASKFNGLTSWLNWKPLLFLGSISYSLYLLHPFFGNRVIRFINYRYDISLTWSVFILIATIGLTIFLVWLFYKIVERPSHNLSKRIEL